jgi:hypothetical protein
MGTADFESVIASLGANARKPLLLERITEQIEEIRIIFDEGNFGFYGWLFIQGSQPMMTRLRGNNSTLAAVGIEARMSVSGSHYPRTYR